MRMSQADEPRDMALVEAERSLKQPSGLPHIFQRLRPVQERHAAHGEVHRVHIVRPFALRTPALCRDEFDADCPCEPGYDLVLHVKEIGPRLVEPLGPHMRAGLGIDELSIDTDSIVAALHTAFQHVAHAKLAAELLRVCRPALEGESGVAGGDIPAPAENALPLDTPVAAVPADAEQLLLVGGEGDVALRHQSLHGDGKTHRRNHREKFDQHAVAGGLDDASAMLSDNRIKCCPMLAKHPGRSFLVRPHHPAVARDVGGQDRYKSTFYALPCHAYSP